MTTAIGYNSDSGYERELSTREKIQYSILGVLIVGGAVVLGRNIIKKATANNEQRKTYDADNPATYAKQIRMAFDNDGWWGTDKDSLRFAIREIPSKAEFRKVMNSYQKLYNQNLLADMQDELKSTEYNEMLAILSAKPEVISKDGKNKITTDKLQGWARRLNAAFNISYGFVPGTDEGAIKAVFVEIPTQDVYKELEVAYQSLYGSSLESDLQTELEFWEYEPMMQIIYGKPKN